MHAGPQAVDFVCGVKTFFPAPGSPGTLRQTKRRSVRDVIFPERFPAHHGRIGEGEWHTATCSLSFITAESEKESEHVAVCLDSVRTDIPLGGQIVRQKARDVNGEIGRFHRSTLRGMTSPKAAPARAVISGKSSAVR